MSATTPTERFHRLLAIIPWVVARGSATVDELCERFTLTRAQLLADLDLLWFVGTPPYSPSDLIEVDVHEDLVTIRYADSFRAPLRLTPEQGLALVAAGQAIDAVPGAEADGPLARALDKLTAALGVDGRVAVDLGAVTRDLLEVLRAAVRDHEVLELDYYSHNRDERTIRSVEPHGLFLDQGAWYLAAHCRLAGGARTFRVERIHAARPTGEHLEADARGAGTTDRLSVAAAIGEQVVVELAPDARWVLEQVPHDNLRELSDGRVQVKIVATARPWLERLLLRLGTDAIVVEGPRTAAADAAARVLARYRARNVGTAHRAG